MLPTQHQQPLRVLLVEDSEDDAALVVRGLCRGGYDLTCERVETREAMCAQLGWRTWDIVIADYAMPRFSGLAALALVQEAGLDLPFIVVSGTIGEDVAVAAMKAGAHDYIMKGNLARLVPAVQRELRDAEVRRERRRVEDALRLRDRAIEAAAEGVVITDPTQPGEPIVYCNPGFTQITGYTADEVMGCNCRFLQGPDTDAAALAALRAALRARRSCAVELINYRKDGTPFWNALSISPIRDASGTVTHFVCLQSDVTERKRLEATLRQEAHISTALARVGRELISSLDTPVLLQRLCQLTAEVLECDSSHTFLWQPQDDAYIPVASHGDTREQWESARVLKIPRALATQLLDRLERDDVAQIATADAPDQAPAALAAHLGTTAALYIALRRGRDIVGLLSADCRGASPAFARDHERIARGIGQLASVVLENARLVEEIERASRLKADFVATMSHELRSPLHVIIGYNSLLLDGEFGALSTEQLDTLRRVDKSSRELLDLVNATLDLSRLEAHQIPLHRKEIRLRDLLEEIAVETQVTRIKPEVTVQWNVAPGLRHLRTDPLKLKVVLKNVISNAMKFTDHGNVTVDAHRRNGGVEISVADTGVGIAPDVLPIIFEAFRQGDSSSTRAHGGVGLGLYIVRRLADILGATVSVDSEVGRGSTFRVWVPTDQRAPAGVSE